MSCTIWLSAQPQGLPVGRIQHGCIIFCHPECQPAVTRLHTGPFPSTFTVMLEAPTPIAAAKLAREADGADLLHWADGSVWRRNRIQKGETQVREIEWGEAKALRKQEQPQSPAVPIQSIHHFVEQYRTPTPAAGPHQ